MHLKKSIACSSLFKIILKGIFLFKIQDDEVSKLLTSNCSIPADFRIDSQSKIAEAMQAGLPRLTKWVQLLLLIIIVC